MNEQLDKQLCEKYPKIFRDRHKSMTETCMYWGFEHGDGWYDILEHLCESLTRTYSTSIELDDEDGLRLGLEKCTYTKKYHFDVKAPQVIADQVKQKFGTLRFYYHIEYDPKLVELKNTGKYPRIEKIMDRYAAYYQGMVHMAEIMSSRTCELTGKKGEMHVSGGSLMGYYHTLNKEEAVNSPELKKRNYVPAASLTEEKAP